MKFTFLRALIAIAAGVMMFAYREQMVVWLTIAIGVMFFISGTISVVCHFVMRRNAQKEALLQDAEGANKARHPMATAFPLVGLGSALLGIILALMPETVTDYLVYLFAALVILGAVGEYVALLSEMSAVSAFHKTVSTDKNSIKVGLAYWVVPTLLLLFGIVAIIYPQTIISAPFAFLGVALVIYGLSECANALKFWSVRKQIIVLQTQIGEAEEVVEAIEIADAKAEEE